MRANEFNARLTRAMVKALNKVKSFTPVDSGNLRDSTVLEKTSKGWVIQVDESKADYFKNVNEDMLTAFGNFNPNRGYFDQAIDAIVGDLANELGGQVKTGASDNSLSASRNRTLKNLFGLR